MHDDALRAAEAGELLPVYAVVGPSHTLVERTRDRLVAAVLPRCGLPAFNHNIVRAGEGGAEEQLAVARTLPMMADRRLVEVRELDEASAAVSAVLVDLVAEGGSPGTVLVLSGAKLPRTAGGKQWGTRLRNALKKSGAAYLDLSKGADPEAFARRMAATADKELEPRAADALVALIGRDLDLLAQEVDKLVLYTGTEVVIRVDDVTAVCAQLAELEAFELTAAVVARDQASAMLVLHRLLEGRDSGNASPDRLLALLTWQLRAVLQVAQAVRMRRPEREIRSSVRLRSDLYRSIRRLLDKGHPPTAATLERLRDANVHMHSSRAGARRVLEVLVMELSG